jgi:1A family penicillin-binding protein
MKLFKKIFRQRRSLDYNKILLAVLSVGIFAGGLLMVWLSSLPIPDLNSFEQRKVLQSTKIYDRTGEILLYDVNQDIRRTIVPIEQISRHAKNATVAIEDAEFYEHNGVKPKAFIRAIFVNIFSLSFSQGGSTITQQVVKNSLLTQEKLISRKLKEWVLAIKLEKTISKERILELYLNENPYGGSIYGIEEASRAYFGKSSADLTLAEAAYLAALPQAPSYYSPYGNHKDKLDERKNLVLERMLENNFINQEDYSIASREKVEFLPRPMENIRAPHFVFFVLDQLREKYGDRAIEEEGLKVTTSLDYELQAKAEAIVKKHALENKTKFNAENASLVAIDPRNGNILTMVGSRDYFDKEIDGNFNIATAHRQPGSSFKPIVYAASFLKGYTPKTVVFDLPTEFSTTCSPSSQPLSAGATCYNPGNYDNKFRGPVTFEEALAQSLNIPAVKVLYLTGINRAIELAERMGIESLGDKNQYGLTLVLGGGEVSLLDMTSAYSIFAAEGVRAPYQSIVKIENNRGEVVEEPQSERREVLPQQVARQITSILSNNALRAPAFGSSSYLHFPGQDVAVKTGTTNDYKDAWIVGYIPSVAVGSWAGNNNNTSMTKNVAGYIVAPMWNEFMLEVLKKYPNERFNSPDPELDDSLKPVLRGVWQGERGVHSILYYLDKDNPRGPAPSNPSNDPQFRLWEPPVASWAERQGYFGQNYPNEGGEQTEGSPTPTPIDILDLLNI